MTAQPIIPTRHPLIDLVDEAHGEVRRALDEGRTLDAVAWTAAHLAAAHRVLAGVVRDEEVDARAARHAHDLRLQRIARLAERRASGDALAAAVNLRRVRARLSAALDEHVRVEYQLLDRLTATLPADRLDRLAADYAAVLSHAPTRPHPHAPHRGPLVGVVFHLDRWRDSLLDTMDGRHAPTRRTAGPRPRAGRWGSYLLGQMEP